jgi:hypothetical protein
MREPSLGPITELQVKAPIARPGPLEAVPRGESYLIRGAAWSCEAEIEIVRAEISTDGGIQWKDARLGMHTDRHAWRLWEYGWATTQDPGRCILMVWTHDSKGRTQPTESDPDRGGYFVNQVLGIEVVVQ